MADNQDAHPKWIPLTTEALEVFRVAVYHCLQSWTALQLALHHEWGGPSSQKKYQQFHSDVVDLFLSKERKRTYQREDLLDQLEDLLDEKMNEYFYTEADDGSLSEVSEQITTFHKECMLGNFENVKRMAAPTSGSGHSVHRSLQLSTEDDHVETLRGNESPGVLHDGIESMNVDSSVPADPSSSTAPSEMSRTNLLTDDDIADGWQVKAARKSRRRQT